MISSQIRVQFEDFIRAEKATIFKNSNQPFGTEKTSHRDALQEYCVVQYNALERRQAAFARRVAEFSKVQEELSQQLSVARRTKQVLMERLQAKREQPIKYASKVLVFVHVSKRGLSKKISFRLQDLFTLYEFGQCLNKILQKHLMYLQGHDLYGNQEKMIKAWDIGTSKRAYLNLLHHSPKLSNFFAEYCMPY